MKINISLSNKAGLDSFIDKIIEDLNPEKNRAKILSVLVEEMRKKEGSIPKRTGQLRRSLTSLNSKDTHFKTTKKVIEFGVKASCPQGYWQLYYHKKRRDLVPDKTGKLIAKAILSSLTRSGGS